MRVICLITGIVFWVGASIDTKLGRFIYLIWIIAFLLTWHGWSIVFSILSFTSSASFKCMSLGSNNFFISTILPWVFGISLIIIILSLNIKYFSKPTHRSGDGYGFDGDLGDDF